jgi:hypothetical protein
MTTPEQKLHAKLKRELTKLLPKGKWMLQRIETSTGSGVPDCYFSFSGHSSSKIDEKQSFTCWLETKTRAYKVSKEQINWQHVHSLTGGKAWIVTEFNSDIVLLDFDDRMLDCSSLDVYIRRHEPKMLTLNSWLLLPK